MSEIRPPLKYCPYCGSDKIYYNQHVPRCGGCRAVFFEQFSRYLRKKATKKQAPPEQNEVKK